MKKFLPITFSLIFVLVFTPFDVFSASLEVSKSSNFSSSDLNFSGAETVYVRVKTGDTGTTHVLNVKDNSYSTVKTVDMSRNGESYTASFSAPSGEGYYSLEAKIEGEGVSVTSVRTIKVGNPSNANIKVNVNSSVKGTSTKVSDTYQASQDSVRPEGFEELDKLEDNGQGQPEKIEAYSALDKGQNSGEQNWFWATVKGVFAFVWPF